MKLYVITQIETGKVIAISESKDDVKAYMEMKDFSDRHYSSIKIKKQSVIDEVMIHYEDLYLEHDDGVDLVLTRVERQMVEDIIGEERSRIKTTIKDLEHYLGNYSFSKKEKSILFKALKIMESSRKKKHLKKVIELESFLGFIHKSKNIADIFRERLHEVKEKMFVFINLKD